MLTGKLRVLIVDDENGIRELFRANLEEEGYECHTAESSEAALEVLASTEFEVALVDITMPRMTGAEPFPAHEGTLPGYRGRVHHGSG